MTFGAVGNIKATLEALLPRLRQHESNLFLSSCVKRYQKDQEAARAETVSGPDATISGSYLTKIINKHAGEYAARSNGQSWDRADKVGLDAAWVAAGPVLAQGLKVRPGTGAVEIEAHGDAGRRRLAGHAEQFP